jgi:hypothetical protein
MWREPPSPFFPFFFFIHLQSNYGHHALIEFNLIVLTASITALVLPHHGSHSTSKTGA